jgi:diguanylate cyclase (GGDEF)-like protein
MLAALLKRHGVAAAVVAVLVASIGLSVGISAAVHAALRIEMSAITWIVTLVCPALIAPTMSWWTFGLVLKLERAHDQLRMQSNIDHLTGIYNRRFFMDRLRAELERANREGTPFAVAVIDVDDFKRINDEHGHLSGDETLRQLTQACARLVRDGDTLARIGGEEFAVLLPATPAAEAEHVVERLRLSVADTRVRLGEVSLGVTVSVGLTTPNHDVHDVNGVLHAADEALYAAKRQGKNRLVVHATYGNSAPGAGRGRVVALD